MGWSEVFKYFFVGYKYNFRQFDNYYFFGNIINKSRFIELDIVFRVELIVNIGLNVLDFLYSYFLEMCQLNQQIVMEIGKEMNIFLGIKYII